MKISFRKDIEGLRALAILLVVGAHAKIPYLTGGFIGVDIFFVLSGYLITGLLLKELTTNGHISYLDFYHRRLKRLLPALVMMVLIMSGVSMVLLAPFEQTGQATSARFATLWISNFYFAFSQIGYFDAISETNLFLHTWSLGVEEQFYLIWPFLLVLIAKRQRDQFFTWFLLIFVLGFILSAGLFGFNSTWAFYLMPSRVWQFAAGGLTYIGLTQFGNIDIRLIGKSVNRNLLGWVGLALVLLSVIVVKKATYPGLWALLPTLGTCLMLFGADSGSVRASGLARALSTPVLQWVGQLSYSWYLWHWPVLSLGFIVLDGPGAGVIALLVALSLVLAVLSYYLIEAPIRFGKRISNKPMIMLPVSIVLCGVLFLGLGKWLTLATKWTVYPEQYAYFKANEDTARIYADGCDDWYRSDTLSLCVYGSRSASNTVVLIGDSIGAQWFPALEKLYLENDWNVVVLTKSSCPIIDQVFYYEYLGRNYTECETWRNAALKWIGVEKPAAVVMGSAQVKFTEEQWIGGTKRVVEKIVDAVGEIYILQPTYSLSFNGPACLAREQWQSQLITPIKSCVNRPDTSHIDNIGIWLTSLATDYDNVDVINMNPYICPNGLCYAEQDGLVRFRDEQHITATFAKSLSGQVGKSVGLQPDHQ